MKQKIQANISGYHGIPVSLFSLYDTEKGILAVAKLTPLETDRKKDFLLVTNIQNAPYKDLAFGEKNFKEAVESFFQLTNGIASDKRSQRIQFSAGTKYCNPEAAIQAAAIETSGTKYILNKDITNAQVATLATCLYCKQSSTVEDAIAMANEIADISGQFYGGEYGFITI